MSRSRGAYGFLRSPPGLRAFLRSAQDGTLEKKLSEEHLTLAPDADITQDVVHNGISEPMRYAFDADGAERREQLLRVDPYGAFWRVTSSVIAIKDHSDVSLRKLPDRYRVALERELPSDVWLHDGLTPSLITTDYLTDGRRILEAEVYIDQAFCSLHTFSGANGRYKFLNCREVPFEERTDVEQVVSSMMEIGKEFGASNVASAYKVIMDGRNLVLSELAFANRLPLGLVAMVGEHEGFFTLHPDDHTKYVMPIGKKEYVFDRKPIFPTKATAPGRRAFDAVNGHQLEHVLYGQRHFHDARKMMAVCQYHNRRLLNA